jgi:small-conductance mechanosensitive channel
MPVAPASIALDATFEELWKLIERPLLSIHGVDISLFSILLFLLTLCAGFVGGRFARRGIARMLLSRWRGPSEGSAYAVGRIAEYLIVTCSVLLALENLGISMTSLAALGAVFAVGLGFGMQTIAQNFVSGVMLRDVAHSTPGVLPDPKASVFFVQFGSSSLDFQLCAWLDDPEAALGVVSHLRHGIVQAFADSGIGIPFPQRDLHIKELPRGAAL